jgi:tetratricopeptide (TPR) repeat protein
MLKPKRKISKKEMKQDTLLTAYAKISAFYFENKKYINYALTALVIIVVGTVIYLNNRAANNAKAAEDFSRVFPVYDAAGNDAKQYQVAIDGQPERGIMGLKALAGMGSCYEAKGDYKHAARNFEKAAATIADQTNTPEYLNSAARCYGLSGDKETAIALFKRLKKEYPTSTYAREVERYINQFSA